MVENNMSSRISRSNNMEEKHSMLSNSSAGSSTLLDNGLHSRKSKSSIANSQQHNFRKFTSAVGRPGQARETREAISRVMSAVNPTRTLPLAEPIDYECFLVEKSSQLENDRNRDLLLFPRDDISGIELLTRESTAVPMVRKRDIEKANWLLTRDMLKYYVTPCTIISFNHAKYSGHFKRFESSQKLTYLHFESDLVQEEEKSQLASNLLNDVIKEGNLTLLPGEGIVDSFKSEKKRFCVLRRVENGKVLIEVYKQFTATQQLLPPIEIKSALIKCTKKGKILQIYPSDSEKALLFSSENESDLQFWLFEIDRALTWNSKDFVTSEDNLSLNSSGRENCSQPIGNCSLDNESLASEDSGTSSGRDSVSIWKGKGMAAKTLQPPPIERKNIFTLYSDIQPLPDFEAEESTLTEALSEVESGNAENIQQIVHSTSKSSSFLKQSQSFMSDSDEIASTTRDLTPDPSTSDLIGEQPAILYNVQLRDLNIRTRFACRETPEQIEPFFLRFFLFNSNLGVRISEEFHIEVPTQRFLDLRSQNIMAANHGNVDLPERFHAISRHRLQTSEKFLCPVQIPHPELFLVVFVERVLSDVQSEIYLKTNNHSLDAKTSVRIQKSITFSFQRLSHLRTLFAWTAMPIFPSLFANGLFRTVQNSALTNLPLFKCDGRMAEPDLQKLLAEMQRPEKVAKWISFPESSLTIEADLTSVISQIPMRISPAYYPLRPWRLPSPENPLTPTFELQSFAKQTDIRKGLTNLLYVYPISLNYGAQKTFTRARNIACTICLVRAEKTDNNKFIQDHPFVHRTNPLGPFVKSFTCSVQYHEQNPVFNDEIKMQLPLSLSEDDHILFSFTHISLSNALSSKSTAQIESPIGFAWIPLVKQNARLDFLNLIEDLQEFDLPISMNLPPEYNGKMKNRQLSSDVKFLENGRPLFRVRLRLVSSIFTVDERIQKFFQLCQKINAGRDSPKSQQALNQSFNASKSCSASNIQDDFCLPSLEQVSCENELLTTIESLTSVNIDRLVSFFQVILDRLFNLLTLFKTQDIPVAALSAIVRIIDSIYQQRKNKQKMVRDYIRLHFNIQIGENGREEDETLHAAIFKFIPVLINKFVDTNKNEFLTMFRQLWFLFDCAVKSMAHWLILNNLHKAPRNSRFPNEVYFYLEELFQTIIQVITEKYKESPREMRQANLALANFIKYCLSIMDRTQIMRELHGVVKKMDSVDSRMFRSYKLDLLKIISGHEHWVPLNLPLLTDKYGGVMRCDTIVLEGALPNHPKSSMSGGGGGFFSRIFSHIFSPSYAFHESNEVERYSIAYSEHFSATETYCSVHFLVGLLLQEFMASLRESREYRRNVIRLMRNLLAKHSIDHRYGDMSAKNRISILYIPVMRFILDNIREMEATFLLKIESPAPAHSPNGGDAHSSRNCTVNAATLGSDIHPFNASHTSKNSTIVTKSSYASSSLSSGQVTTNSLVPSIQAAVAHSNRASKEYEKEHLPFALLPEKFEKAEIRDLILSALYVINGLPKKILAAFYNALEKAAMPTQKTNSRTPKKGDEISAEADGTVHQAQNQLTDIIRFFDLALVAFRYKGKSYHIMRQSKQIVIPSNSISNTQTSTSTTSADISTTGNGPMEDKNFEEHPNIYLMDCHLSQEVALIVLEASQVLSNHIATKTRYTSSQHYDLAFIRLLNLQIELLSEHWPESIRIQALAALAVFVNLFSSRFFSSGPLDCLSNLIKAILLQLNSRMSRAQSSAAALLQLILRGGFDASNTPSSIAKLTDLSTDKGHSNYSLCERLGRPGAQVSVALARLLSEKPVLLDNTRFEMGLAKIESIICAGKQLGPGLTYLPTISLFERAVLELVKQLRGVLEATRAISDMIHSPIQLADLHIQLADSYRGSAVLRSEFFDALANLHLDEGWYSEAAVCQAHSLAIVGKELQAKGQFSPDWNILNVLNEQICREEGVAEDNSRNTQQGGFTLEDFTRKVESVLRSLILSERYEAVGPICRLSIPVFERQHDFKSLVSIYAELQQACSRAAEVKANGKRHLASYFKVVFHGQSFFKEEDKSEWIYREAGLTSLAEACERILESTKQAYGNSQIALLSERADNLDPNIAFVQVAHIEACQRMMPSTSSKIQVNGNDGQRSTKCPMDDVDPEDSMNYHLHTNICTFIQEEKIVDKKVPMDASELARTALRRLILTSEKPFPNTRRRQRIVRTEENILSPLEVACESLKLKAAQVRRILTAADLSKGYSGAYDKSSLKRLDLKQLQLYLQGSVSPTVNAGLLAYAETFTAKTQIERYGQSGTDQLVAAFKILIPELDEALRVNEAALGGERIEYQGMLRQSFDGMLERLSMFFENEKFLPEQKKNDEKVGRDDFLALGVFDNISRMGTSAAEMHILDSISGLNN